MFAKTEAPASGGHRGRYRPARQSQSGNQWPERRRFMRENVRFLDIGWERGKDSNFRFRAFLSLRGSSVISIPCSRSAEGTNAESGSEAISVQWKESGGLPIAVGCTRSKTGRVPCLHICWAEQCEPDILLYRSPYKCFPLEKTGCNPS